MSRVFMRGVFGSKNIGAGFLLFLMVTVIHAVGMAQIPDSVRAQWPDADSADVHSPAAIVNAAYEAISVKKGKERDLDRLRSLFLPKARLMPTDRHKGKAVYRIFSMKEFVERVKKRRNRKGFIESEIHRKVDRFGDIAHVWSTYESRRSPKDSKPFERGINSFQLWYDGDRWWIVSIMWHNENKDAKIPASYGG